MAYETDRYQERRGKPTIRVQGKLIYRDIEGGFYLLETANKTYRLVNEQQWLNSQGDGATVDVSGIVEEPEMSLQMDARPTFDIVSHFLT